MTRFGFKQVFFPIHSDIACRMVIESWCFFHLNISRRVLSLIEKVNEPFCFTFSMAILRSTANDRTVRMDSLLVTLITLILGSDSMLAWDEPKAHFSMLMARGLFVMSKV